MVTVSVTQGDIATADADAIVVNLFEGITSPGGGTGAPGGQQVRQNPLTRDWNYLHR